MPFDLGAIMNLASATIIEKQIAKTVMTYVVNLSGNMNTSTLISNIETDLNTLVSQATISQTDLDKYKTYNLAAGIIGQIIGVAGI